MLVILLSWLFNGNNNFCMNYVFWFRIGDESIFVWDMDYGLRTDRFEWRLVDNVRYFVWNMFRMYINRKINLKL